jgi:hypothetical protein
MDPPFELDIRPFLKDPGVHQNEPAIAQHHNCAGEEQALGPFQDQRHR